MHPRTLVEEREEEAPQQDDGWLEVGKRNRTVVTRTVGIGICVHTWVVDLTFLGQRKQVKNAESPISRIFGGKYRSTLRAQGQKDSVIVEDWRALRLDIQVCEYIFPTTRYVLTTGFTA